MAIKQLPKRYHPDFRLPNKKPVGDVEIDWSNPLSRGASLVSNTVNGIDLKGAPSSKPNGLSSSGGVSNFASNQYVRYEDSPSLRSATGVGQAFSLALIDFSFTTTSNLVVCEKGTNASILVQTKSSKIVFRGGGILDTPDTTDTFNDGKLHNFVGTHNGNVGAGAINLYVDNTRQGTKETTEATAAQNTAPFSVGSRLGSLGFGGRLSYVVVWNRELSVSEALEITRNPYQILKPKQAPSYFTIDAGGGTITVTGTTANYTYAAISGTVELTGTISVTGATPNYTYAAIAGVIELTPQITVTGATPNYTYSAISGTVESVGIINVTGTTPNYAYTAISGDITLLGTITVTGDTPNYSYSALRGVIQFGENVYTNSFVGFAPDITAFNGVVKSSSFNGIITDTSDFSGFVKSTKFLGVKQ